MQKIAIFFVHLISNLDLSSTILPKKVSTLSVPTTFGAFFTNFRKLIVFSWYRPRITNRTSNDEVDGNFQVDSIFEIAFENI